jgi:hypothetical protein
LVFEVVLFFLKLSLNFFFLYFSVRASSCNSGR